MIRKQHTQFKIRAGTDNHPIEQMRIIYEVEKIQAETYLGEIQFSPMLTKHVFIGHAFVVGAEIMREIADYLDELNSKRPLTDEDIFG